MATLPTPGGDTDTWGDELNTYLQVEHAADGTHLNILRGAGSPEGAVTGTVGQIYQRTNGSTGTSLYIKETGSGNTGWVAVAASASGAPTTGTYITQVAEAGLSAEQALGALATGIVKNTTTTGVLSIAAGSDLPTAIPIAKLADPTTGKVIGSAASAAAAVYPPGYQWAYNALTTSVTTTQTVQASADTVLAGTATTYDGATVLVQVGATIELAASATMYLTLWKDGVDTARMAQYRMFNSTTGGTTTVFAFFQDTPTAGSHTYALKTFVSASTGTVFGSATASFAPAFIRVVKV